MNTKSLAAKIIVTFIVSLVVITLLTFLWNTLRYGATVVNWNTAFILAIIFGIALPLADGIKRQKE